MAAAGTRRRPVGAPHVERLRALSFKAPASHPGYARKARVGRIRSDSVSVAVEGRGPAPLSASWHPREAGESRGRGLATEHGLAAEHGSHTLEHRRHTPSHVVVIAHEVSEPGVQTAHGGTVTTRATAMARRAARRAVATAVAAVAAPSLEVSIAVTTESERIAGHNLDRAEEGFLETV